MNRSALARPLACLLVAALATAVATTPAAETVSLSGRVFQPDGTTPYANVVLRVIDQETGAVRSSAPTDAAGRYEFKDLPAGTYSFEVEVPEGIYRLDRVLKLGENDTASISFTVKPEPADGEGDAAPPKGERRLRRGRLVAIILGGATFGGLLVSGLDDDDDDEASPFTP